MNITVLVPAHEVEVEVPDTEIPECTGATIQTFNSFAGSSEQYVGTEEFRARALGSHELRIHISRDLIRERVNYVALDINAKEALRTLALAMSVDG